MKLRKLVVCALILLVINCLSLIEGKKMLLAALLGYHAARRTHGLQHLHKLVSVYVPLRMATEAWRSFGKASAHTPHMPHILKTMHHHEHLHHPKSIKLSHEEAHEMDNWLSHHFPEEEHSY